MTEYEDTLMTNFMICGICPNTIWRNLLTKQLTDHRLGVLFCYPDSEEEQACVLEHIFPESFRIQETRPRETDIERYILTNEEAETFYVYCKVMYEEITEEFLSTNYDIKNVQPKKHESRADLFASMLRSSVLSRSGAETPRPAMLKSRCLADTDSEKGMHPFEEKPKAKKSSDYSVQSEENKGHMTTPHRSLKREVSFTTQSKPFKHKQKNFRLLQPQRSSVMLSLDEMDIVGTAYNKVAKRVRKKSDHKHSHIEIVPRHLHKSYFVPLAVCVKTKNQNHESAEQLLTALLSLLSTESNNYKLNIQNLIYSYSEFVSHAMLLTHMISPPPMTQYSLWVGPNEVQFSEGLIGELPGEGDTSVAQLFSIVDADFIIPLWTAMLLDIRVIVYTSDVNEYFFVVKALSQLMFPFKWHHSKGVIPLLYFLLQPPPYCFGLMKTMFPNKTEIYDSLCEERIPHMLLDLSAQSLSVFPKEDRIVYPGEETMRTAVRGLCKRFEIARTGGLIKKPEQRHADFSRLVRQLFLTELLAQLVGFDSLVRKTKSEDFYAFKTNFVKLCAENDSVSTEKGSARKQEELRFVRELTEAQCFACTFHEAYSEEQQNYARVQAMRRRGKLPAGDLARVTITAPQSVILGRVSRLAEAASKARSKAKIKNDNEASDNAILLKNKIDWVEEISKMQGMLMRQQPDFKPSKRAIFGYKKSAGSGESLLADPLSGLQSKKDDTFDLRITIEEQKTDRVISMIYRPVGGATTILSSSNTASPTATTVTSPLTQTKLNEKMKRPRKGPFFYGPTGMIAFCQELFGVGRKDRNAVNFFDEVKGMLEKTRGSGSNNKPTTSSSTGAGESPIITPLIRAKDDCLSEGTVLGIPQVRLISPLLEALIEPKDLMRRSTGSRTEEPYMMFSSPMTPQFHVFCAIYYSKCGQHPYDIVKFYLEAYKQLVQPAIFSSYLPVLHFKKLIQQLDFEVLRDLLATSGEDVYDSKLVARTPTEKKRRPANSDMLTKIRRTLDVTNPEHHHSRLTLPLVPPPEMRKSAGGLGGGDPLPSSSPVAGSSPRLPFEDVKSVGKSDSVPSVPAAHHVNDFPKLCKFVDPDPVTVAASALGDLIVLMKKARAKEKGPAMFSEVKKHPKFELVEKEFAALRASSFLIKEKGRGDRKEVMWLQRPEEKLCFFVNLFNLLVMFSLCKDGSKPVPRTQLEWTNYLRTVAVVRLGPHVLTAYEIEHAILKATMCVPKMPNPCPSERQQYPKFPPTDPRSWLCCAKKEPLIHFTLHLPTKSSPSLRVYSVDTLQAQMRDNASKYFARTVKLSKSQVSLPAILEWHEDDLIRGDGRDDLLFFVVNCLSRDALPKLKQAFSTGAINDVKYEAYDWAFAYDYPEG